MLTLSPSQITSLFGQWACPASYYWSYINKQRRKPNHNFDIGKAVENCITCYHETGEIKPEIYMRTIEDLKKANFFNELPNEEKDKYNEEIEDMRNKLETLLFEYKKQVPKLEIISSQQKLEMKLNDDVSIIGYPDYIAKGEKKPKIIDVKTAGRSWSEADIDKKIQGEIYVMMAEDSLGELADFEYHVLVKTKTPKIQIIHIEITQERLDQLLNLIEQAGKAKEKFDFIPSEMDKKHCSVCGKDHSLDFYFD